VRLWWNRFGPIFARDIRQQRVSRMRGFCHWRWHLNEMYVKLNGEMVYLWRAVDHEGEVLESYVTKARDKAAALTFMRKALKRHGSPDKITTHGLRSYGAAMNELGCRDRQEVGRWANNRVENSHLAFRRRERAMLRFRQMKTLQKFASVHANVHNHFSLERHLIDRQTYRERRSAALAEWQALVS
jgi:putative transposase